jgi:hypothetical protein
MSQEISGHTKGSERWRAFESALQRGAWGIETLADGDSETFIAPTRGLSEETAKHLADIKNSRDDLLAALECANAHIKYLHGEMGHTRYSPQTAEQINAAIAKARGQ